MSFRENFYVGGTYTSRLTTKCKCSQCGTSEIVNKVDVCVDFVCTDCCEDNREEVASEIAFHEWN